MAADAFQHFRQIVTQIDSSNTPSSALGVDDYGPVALSWNKDTQENGAWSARSVRPTVSPSASQVVFGKSISETFDQHFPLRSGDESSSSTLTTMKESENPFTLNFTEAFNGN